MRATCSFSGTPCCFGNSHAVNVQTHLPLWICYWKAQQKEQTPASSSLGHHNQNHNFCQLGWFPKGAATLATSSHSTCHWPLAPLHPPGLHVGPCEQWRAQNPSPARHPFPTCAHSLRVKTHWKWHWGCKCCEHFETMSCQGCKKQL